MDSDLISMVDVTNIVFPSKLLFIYITLEIETTKNTLKKNYIEKINVKNQVTGYSIVCLLIGIR